MSEHRFVGEFEEVERATAEARSNGHTLGPFEANGTVRWARCTRCLCIAWIDFAASSGEPESEGVGLGHRCDSTIDKGVEFARAPMGEAHRAAISRPWEHPSKVVVKA